MFRFWETETNFSGQNIQSLVVKLVGDQARSVVLVRIRWEIYLTKI